jgi:preprotein translocase subunit SecA
MANLLTKIFGSKHERDVKALRPIVDQINEIYQTLADKPDDWFIQRTREFQNQLAPLGQKFLEEVEQNRDIDS